MNNDPEAEAKQAEADAKRKETVQEADDPEDLQQRRNWDDWKDGRLYLIFFKCFFVLGK